MKKKRIIIVIVWIVFMLVAGFILERYEYGDVSKQATEELKMQAEFVAEQIPEYLDESGRLYIETVMKRDARLQALCLAVGNETDLRKVKALAEEFCDIADIRGIGIFDTSGVLHATVGEVKTESLPMETQEAFPEGSSRQMLEDYVNDKDMFQQVELSTDSMLDSSYGYMQTEKCGPWILEIEFYLSEEEEKIADAYNLHTILSNTRICDSGSILMIDENNGTVLVYEDSSRNGKNVEELGIQLNHSTSFATLEDIKNTFSDCDQVLRIKVDGKEYYAVRMDVNHSLMLALLPEKEVRDEALAEMSAWMFIIALISGTGLIFVWFYLAEEDENLIDKGRYVFNKSFSNKIWLATVLAVLLTVIMGLFVEVLSKNAEFVRYNQKKAMEISAALSEDRSVKESIVKTYRDDCLLRAKIAGLIVSKEDPERLTSKYMNLLSDRLDVQYCSLYDPSGKMIATNSPYEAPLDPESEFYSLLEGRKELSGEFEPDENTMEYFQKAGVPIYGKDGKLTGVLILESDVTDLASLVTPNSLESALKKVYLDPDSTVMLLTGDEEKKVEYLAFGRDDNTEEYFDESEEVMLVDISYEGDKIKDQFVGSFRLLGKKYNACVCDIGKEFLVMMHGRKFFGFTASFMILLEAVFVFLFMTALQLITCVRKKEEKSEPVEEKAAADSMGVSGSEAAEEESGKGDDMLSVLSSLTNKNKPYFEERWAKDSTKWKDKTPSQKFSTVMVLVSILAVFSIIIQALILGEKSVWYYCLLGEWDKGINIHSIVTCLIAIGILFFVKLLIHKFLYVTARAVGAWGETICHLLDSFLIYFLVVAGILVCLAIFGVNLRTITLTGGVTGVIISISCQNIVADMLAGILMTFEGVAKVGDFVMFNGSPGVVLSVGVRTTRLKWFGEITAVRNNDFKNFIDFPNGSTNRLVVRLTLDYRESLERAEAIFDKELPVIHEHLVALAGEGLKGPTYRGMDAIDDKGMVVSFSIFCDSRYKYWINRMVNREFIFMCERNDLLLALPQITINEPREKMEFVPEREAEEDQKGQLPTT